MSLAVHLTFTVLGFCFVLLASFNDWLWNEDGVVLLPSEGCGRKSSACFKEEEQHWHAKHFKEMMSQVLGIGTERGSIYFYDTYSQSKA